MPISYYNYMSENEEAGNLAAAISALIEQGESPEDIAVIYRTNRQSRAPEDAFMAAKVPYRIIGSRGFFGRFQVQAVTSFLKVVGGIGGDPGKDALVRAVQVQTFFTKYVGKDTAEKAAYLSKSDPVMGMTRVKAGAMKSRTLANFVTGILNLRAQVGTMEVSDLIQVMAEAVGLVGWLASQKSEDDSTPETNGDGQKSLLDDVKETAKAYGTDLAAYLDYVQTTEDSAVAPADASEKGHGKVTMLTIHRSKGLEWKHVFAIGWSEGLLPHKMSMGTETQVEEERRMAYVAMTRATDFLYVSSLLSYSGVAMEPSRFATEAGLYEYLIEAEEVAA